MNALEPVGGGPVVPVIFWPGSGSTDLYNKTGYGLYEDDDEFIDDAPKTAKWICHSLGYPVVSVELTEEIIYTQIESATMEFSSIVNEFNMRENIFLVQGMPTGSNFTQKLVKNSPIPLVVKLAADYGTEAMSGGSVTVNRGYITMVRGQQEYDLQALWANVSESANRMEIKRIFHERVPAMQRFFDPFAGTGTDMSALLGSFGWTGFAVASNFLIMPAYETLLRAQAIELNDQIRRSNYSFELRNNKIRLYPVPDETGEKMWFEYVVEKDKLSGKIEAGVISDYSNVPYNFIPYQYINSVGRRWIYQCALAHCKIVLGEIRSKYDSMPIPNSEIRLDGASLRQEGKAELEALHSTLRETLIETGKQRQLEKQKANEFNSNDLLKLTPTLIYIG